jgi:hypothetical protein
MEYVEEETLGRWIGEPGLPLETFRLLTSGFRIPPRFGAISRAQPLADSTG